MQQMSLKKSKHWKLVVAFQMKTYRSPFHNPTNVRMLTEGSERE